MARVGQGGGHGCKWLGKAPPPGRLGGAPRAPPAPTHPSACAASAAGPPPRLPRRWPRPRPRWHAAAYWKPVQGRRQRPLPLLRSLSPPPDGSGPRTTHTAPATAVVGVEQKGSRPCRTLCGALLGQALGGCKHCESRGQNYDHSPRDPSTAIHRMANRLLWGQKRCRCRCGGIQQLGPLIPLLQYCLALVAGPLPCPSVLLLCPPCFCRTPPIPALPFYPLPPTSMWQAPQSFPAGPAICFSTECSTALMPSARSLGCSSAV